MRSSSSARNADSGAIISRAKAIELLLDCERLQIDGRAFRQSDASSCITIA